MMITLDAVQLYDMGFGPLMVPVAPPGVQIAPNSTLKKKALGKAPGKLTLSGWVGVDLNDPKTRCPDYQTAKLWTEWHANVGLAAGEGLVIIDNDQGAEFSRFLYDAFQSVGVEPLRRYVQDPKHERDAWLFQVRDFIGEPVSLPNMNLTFQHGMKSAAVQLLAKGKQLVVSGVHPGTQGPYVLDRPLAFDELPVLSEDQLKAVFEKFNLAISTQGWTPVGAVSQPVSRPGTPVRNLIPSSQDLTQEQIDSAVAGGAALLAHIPNREMPAKKEDQTKADLWLHDYDNWIRIAYALIAHLGAAADAPQARNLWLEWALARPQEQDPDTVWTSALRQPLRFDGRGLIQVIQSIGVLPSTGFPDPDLNDPAFKVPPVRTTKTPLWDKLKGGWALLALGTGWFLNLETGIAKHPKAFSYWLAPDRKALMKELGIKPKKGEHMSVASIFCDQPDRLVYHDLIYAPGEPHELPDGVFNRWKQTPIQPQAVDPKRIERWLKHVRYVLGDAHGDWFIKWCAFVAQHPMKKPNWHFLTMTKQGVGKDRMMRPVELAVGRGNYRHSDVSVFYEPFNEPLETRLLIVSEMSKSHNDAQSRRAGDRFKLVLSAPPPTIPINPKYQPKFEAKNRLAAVMFANDSVPLMLERNQRRVYVANQLHVQLETPDYYDTLAKWLEVNDEENAKLVASYLLALPLPDDKTFLGNAPSSDDKTELEERNAHPGLRLLEEIIDEARNGAGPYPKCLAPSGSLANTITARGVRVNSVEVGGWLRDMEREEKGVGRVRVNQAKPTQCGAVVYNGESERLWHLAEKSLDGRPWADISNAELLAMWHGRPAPASAKVLNFPKTVDGDEKV